MFQKKKKDSNKRYDKMGTVLEREEKKAEYRRS